VTARVNRNGFDQQPATVFGFALLADESVQVGPQRFGPRIAAQDGVFHDPHFFVTAKRHDGCF
jgi:hypothetical protein